MAKKKPTLQGKTWRFGGETLFPAELSETEERILSDVFSQIQTFSMTKPSVGLSASVIRGRETVARACLGYFRERFSDQYDSATIAQSLATAVAFPTKTGDLWPDCNSTLFAAALWTLDYINQQNLQSELLPLLPETLDPNVELQIPSAEDFRYPRGLAAHGPTLRATVGESGHSRSHHCNSQDRNKNLFHGDNLLNQLALWICRICSAGLS